MQSIKRASALIAATLLGAWAAPANLAIGNYNAAGLSGALTKLSAVARKRPA